MAQNINPPRHLTSPGWRRIMRQDMRARVLWPTVRLVLALYAVVGVVFLIAGAR